MQQKLTKELYADILHGMKKKDAYISADLIDVLDHLAYANAPVEVGPGPSIKEDIKPKVSPKEEISSPKKPRQTFAPKICARCGKEFTPKGPRTKYCEECRAEIKRESNREYVKSHPNPKKTETEKPEDDIANVAKEILALGD